MLRKMNCDPSYLHRKLLFEAYQDLTYKWPPVEEWIAGFDLSRRSGVHEYLHIAYCLTHLYIKYDRKSENTPFIDKITRIYKCAITLFFLRGTPRLAESVPAQSPLSSVQVDAYTTVINYYLLYDNFLFLRRAKIVSQSIPFAELRQEKEKIVDLAILRKVCCRYSFVERNADFDKVMVAISDAMQYCIDHENEHRIRQWLILLYAMQLTEYTCDQFIKCAETANRPTLSYFFTWLREKSHPESAVSFITTFRQLKRDSVKI